MPPVQKGTEDVLQLAAPEAVQPSTLPDWYFNSYCTGAVLHVPTYLTHRKEQYEPLRIRRSEGLFNM